MGLLEREEELAALRGGMDALRAGHGRLLLVEGPPGIGRSALLSEAERLARARGLAATRVHAVESDATAPMALAVGAATAYIIDDAQWLDAATLDWLIGVEPELATRPALVVLALSTDGPAIATERFLRLRTAAEVEVLRPAPLSPAALDLLAGDAERAVAETVAEESAGIPLVAVELLAGGGSVTDRLQLWLARRMGRLGPDAGALARAAALLGGAVPLHRAAGLAGLERERAEAAADALTRASLLAGGEPLRFAAEAFRRSLLEAMAPYARARGHYEAARALAQEGAPAGEIADHLLHVHPGADPWVVEQLRHAARDGAPSPAARYLARALAEPPPGGDRSDVLIELALAEEAGGVPGAVDRVAEAFELASNTRDRSLLLAARVREQVRAARFREAAELADSELSGGDVDAAVIPSLTAGYLHGAALDAAHTGDADLYLAPFVAAAREGNHPEDPTICAHVARRLAVLGDPLQVVSGVAEHAFAAHMSSGVRDPLSWAMGFAALLQADLVDQLDRQATAGIALATERGDAPLQAEMRSWRALARVRTGRLVAAEADARGALAQATAASPLLFARCSLALVWARALLGDARGATEGLSTFDAVGDVGVPAVFRSFAEGQAAGARGDPAAAQAAFEAANVQLEEALGPARTLALPVAAEAALAAARAGDSHGAGKLAALELERVRPGGRAGQVGLAVHARALASDAGDRTALLTESEALLRHSPARVAHARALLDLGRVRREAGDADGAREALHEALDLADRCDAAGLVGQGLGELRACGERPRRAARTGIRALTPAERRAAELAAGGDTNSVIAGTLVVSLKTVEGHLHNAYRKLGVESREQLRAALAPVDYHR
ncbi:MAG: hypothetical protein QOI80_745 [Solirubrobacteraceae bacterium]|nr:hypothetical protein [Solirubrobacteraceae bacterium]